MTEREYKTFRKERKEPKPISEGAWETILVAIKTRLPFTPGETMGPGDSDFWIEIEDKATMKPREACMEFYLHNIGHRSLAEAVVFSFQMVRTATKMGDIDKDRKKIMTDSIANSLLKYYPSKYRARFGK